MLLAEALLHPHQLTPPLSCALIRLTPMLWVYFKEPFVSQAPSMRKRHRFNRRMTRIVLLISFLFFFGRFVYSSIGAWYHHQDKKASQESTLTVEPSARE